MFGKGFPGKFHILFTIVLRDTGRLSIVSKKENISLTIERMVTTEGRPEIKNIVMLWGRLLNSLLWNAMNNYSRNSLARSISLLET